MRSRATDLWSRFKPGQIRLKVETGKSLWRLRATAQHACQELTSGEVAGPSTISLSPSSELGGVGSSSLIRSLPSVGSSQSICGAGGELGDRGRVTVSIMNKVVLALGGR